MKEIVEVIGKTVIRRTESADNESVESPKKITLADINNKLDTIISILNKK